MIELVETPNKGVIFKLTEQGEYYFNALAEHPLIVVAIAGPQRTGKSFLANAIMDRMDGFAIGDSVQPCTKGIWVWGKPLDHEGQKVVILDTEGLHSIYRGKQLDSAILGIALLLSSVFVYNNFGVIDEKELTDISTVIELTKWIKEGNVVPYFLWCLRDFMLDISEYESPDHYLETVLSTKDYHLNDEKYNIRRNLNDFFKERNCLCFVRPINDEAKLREIQKLKPTELKKEFNQTLEEFKQIVFSRLKPKRIKERVINGHAFVCLIKDILNAFNSKKVPEITSSIERIFENERRETLEAVKALIDTFVKENIDLEDLQKAATEKIWEKLIERANSRQDPELPNAMFSDCFKYLHVKLEQEKGNRGIKFLRELESHLEDLINEPDFNVEKMSAELRKFFVDRNCWSRELSVRFVHDKVISKVFRKVSLLINDIEKHYKYELGEKEKDVEAEKEKRKLDKKLIADQKTTLSEYQSKIQLLDSSLKNKMGEIADMRKIDSNEQSLLNQLSLYRDDIERLENELRISKEVF